MTLPSVPTKLSSTSSADRRVRVLALLPDDSVAMLQAALARGHMVERLPDAARLAASVSGLKVDAVVVDPSILDDGDWARLRSLLASPRIPVLLYAGLTQKSVARIVEASAIGVHEVMLRSHDDDPESIRARLKRLRTPAPPVRVLARIAERLACLPPVMQRVTVPLFCSGRVPRWADEVALAAGIPRRSVDRWMSRAELAGTATLLDVARLARVWVPIALEGADPADVALRGGFLRARMLAVHARRIVGVSPANFRTQLKVDDFVDRLVRYALRA